MKRIDIKKVVVVLCVLFAITGIAFTFGDKLFNGSSVPTVNNGDMTMPEANAVTDEITKNIVIEQKFKYTPDTISEIAIVFTRKYYSEGISIVIELLDGDTLLATDKYKIEGIDDQHRTYLKPDKMISGVSGKELTLRIYPETKKDTGMAIMMQENNNTVFSFGNKEIKGTLCFSVSN